MPVPAFLKGLRFLVIGDLGKDADEDSKDVTRLKTYAEIQKKTGFLQEQAENHGVYEIGMSAFLEFLGYTKKRTVWRSEQTFVAPPVFLANGSKSSSVSSSIGNRESAGQVSPLFSKRKRPNPASQGGGQRTLQVGVAASENSEKGRPSGLAFLYLCFQMRPHTRNS